MTDTHPRGRFVWYELMTSDPEAALSFYTELVGWGTEIFGSGDPPYTMLTGPQGPLAGVMVLPEEARQDGARPHWIAYVDTPDVDATTACAEELGGGIYVPPTDIPNVGRFSVLADPQGAIFAIYRSATAEPGPDEPPALQQVSWHELATTDPDAAWAFYNELLGWQKGEAMDMGEAGIYQMYHAEGSEIPLGGIFEKPAEMPGPSAWLLYVLVPDVHAGAETVRSLGGQVLNGPMEVPGGDHIVQCMDPQGAAFALHSTAQG